MALVLQYREPWPVYTMYKHYSSYSYCCTTLTAASMTVKSGLVSLADTKGAQQHSNVLVATPTHRPTLLKSANKPNNHNAKSPSGIAQHTPTMVPIAATSGAPPKMPRIIAQQDIANDMTPYPVLKQWRFRAGPRQPRAVQPQAIQHAAVAR